MPDRPCKHERTRVIAEDRESRYTECLECGEESAVVEYILSTAVVEPSAEHV